MLNLFTILVSWAKPEDSDFQAIYIVYNGNRIYRQDYIDGIVDFAMADAFVAGYAKGSGLRPDDYDIDHDNILDSEID